MSEIILQMLGTLDKNWMMVIKNVHDTYQVDYDIAI